MGPPLALALMKVLIWEIRGLIALTNAQLLTSKARRRQFRLGMEVKVTPLS